MLTDVFQKLHLKEKFEVFTAASKSDINKFSENIKPPDSAACLDITKTSMKKMKVFRGFLILVITFVIIPSVLRSVGMMVVLYAANLTSL